MVFVYIYPGVCYTLFMSAEDIASKQREVTVSAFFAKNKQFLGFDSPGKAVVMAVKEGVDNSLDACEESGILPNITVRITDKDGVMIVSILDNGPGIVTANITSVFCKLLYGSKFDSWTSSRGAQGLGISAAGMYGFLTTGQPMTVYSKVKGKEGIGMMFHIDTKTNSAKIIKEMKCEDKLFPEGSGTFVSIPMDGKYVKGARSVDNYLETTAFANPHASIHFINPRSEVLRWNRVSEIVPPKPKKVKPYPTGMTYQNFVELLQAHKKESIRKVLSSQFSNLNIPAINFLLENNQSLASKSCEDILENEKLVKAIFFKMSFLCSGRLTHHANVDSFLRKASIYIPSIKKSSNESTRKPKSIPSIKEFVAANFDGIPLEKAETLLGNNANVKINMLSEKNVRDLYTLLTTRFFSISPPSMDSFIPIGNDAIKARLQQKGAGSVIVNTLQGLTVSGNPMMIEIGIGFEGKLDKNGQCDLMRFANRVPLLHSPKACAITEAVSSIDWSSCGVTQKPGEMPTGAMIFVVNVYSLWIPFTDPAKEAISHNPEILKALRKGLMECRRGIEQYLVEKNKDAEREMKLKMLSAYANEIEMSLIKMLGPKLKGFKNALMHIVEKEK